jgi:hypothetical protein
VFRTLLAGVIVAGVLWLVTRHLPVETWVWTLALAALHVAAYAALIVAFRVVRPAEIRPLMGNLLRVKG